MFAVILNHASQRYEPVDDLLDYILEVSNVIYDADNSLTSHFRPDQHSDVSCAVASDYDFRTVSPVRLAYLPLRQILTRYGLHQDVEVFPSDIRAALLKRRPKISALEDSPGAC